MSSLVGKHKLTRQLCSLDVQTDIDCQDGADRLLNVGFAAALANTVFGLEG